MKSFIIKSVKLALFGFVISSSVFAAGTTQVTVKFPDSTYALYQTPLIRDKYGDDWSDDQVYKKTRDNTDDWKSSTYTISPKSNDVYKFWVQHNGKTIETSILENKNFAGSGYWKWIFDKNGNHTREGLDFDQKTVLYREVNGVLTYNGRDSHKIIGSL